MLLLLVIASLVAQSVSFCELNGNTLNCDGESLENIVSQYTPIKEKIMELKISHGEQTHRTLKCKDVPFPNLQKLEISYGLEELAVNSFNNSMQIKHLNLSNNQLTDFPEETLKKLSLEIFDVSRNRISKIATVQHLASLKKLNLSTNMISIIENTALKAFPNLTALDLSHNLIYKLEENTFEGLSKLEMINLTNNKLNEIPRELFRGIPRLKTAVLSGNNFKSVLRLDLSSNKYLTYLDIRSCNIKTNTPLMLKNLNNLKYLDLSHNVLNNINVDVFDDLINIERIVMTSANLLSLRKPVFRRNLNLRYLDVSRSKISQLGEFLFTTNRELHTLNASRNSLVTLPNNIFKATSLRIIELSYNSISKINWRIFDLPTLDYLGLRGNRIGDLTSYTFIDSFSLKHLDLRDNSLVFVESFLFDAAKNLVSFDFIGNPFNCRCLDELFVEVSSRNITFTKGGYFDGSKALCVMIHDSCVKNENYLNEYRIIFLDSDK